MRREKRQFIGKNIHPKSHFLRDYCSTILIHSLPDFKSTFVWVTYEGIRVHVWVDLRVCKCVSFI